MNTHWTIEDLKKSKVAGINQHLVLSPAKKKHKFHANPCEIDGIKFPSTREANRYKKLKGLLKIGVIGLLERQVEYELNPGGAFSYKYISDFEYVIKANGEKIVEDCKGFRTREYKKKRRLMKKIHGIKIKET